ncbi:hypothetical protein N7463_000811 [Penicillium fimorum]|uniref:Uncharacterized protein n=1 Tax=Penicillium fimorum TaxID=1882269 RepID=A0A9W9Y6R7_9EURO|nr:hypothetical protein N7463_000811 [Penicillium fimorum]
MPQLLSVVRAIDTITRLCKGMTHTHTLRLINSTADNSLRRERDGFRELASSVSESQAVVRNRVNDSKS